MKEKTKEKVKKDNKLKKFFLKSGNLSLDLLFPQDMKCIFCGRDIQDFEDKPYCKDCEKKGVLNNGHRCRICDMPISDSREVCEYCSGNRETSHYKNKFDKAFCPFLYNDTTKGAVVRFKDDNAKYLTKTFAKYILQRISEENISIDVIIPVPSHPKTIRRRGYNQAELLANEIGKNLNVPVNTTSILKTVYSKQQKKLSFQERRKNIRKSLSFQNLGEFKDKNVLIVDDVLTTCATMNAIAEKLKPKTNNIYVATIARRDIKDSKPRKVNILKKIFQKVVFKKNIDF